MNVRNIAFVGHPSSGKTTLVDALAFALGAIKSASEGVEVKLSEL